MTPYSTVLSLHSWLRWFVIFAGFWAIASALASTRPSPRGTLAGFAFTALLDLQLLVGLLLYFVMSPITRAAMDNMRAAMTTPAWRFWTVEHPALMLVAIVFAHLGRISEKKGGGRTGRRMLVWYALAVAALVLAAPWPFMPQGRPWIRIP